MAETFPEEPQTEPMFHVRPATYGGDGAHESNVIEYPDSQAVPPVVEAPAPPPEIKRRKIKDLGHSEMLDVALEGRLPEHMPGIDDTRRDAFIKRYKWVPGSKLEMTAAIGQDKWGNAPLVQYVLGAKNNHDGGLYAIREVVSSITRIRREAKDAIEELDKAFHPTTKEFLPGVIKDEHFVRVALVEEVLAINSLNLADWPKRIISKKGHHHVRNKTFDNMFNQLESMVADLPPEQAEVLCRRTLLRQQERLKFWAEQFDLASEHEDTRALMAAVKVTRRVN